MSVTTDRANGLRALGNAVEVLRDTRQRLSLGPDAEHASTITRVMGELTELRHLIANGEHPHTEGSRNGPSE